MSNTGQGALFRHEQFRMHCLEVFNWGTFDGLHTVPIASEGFLFVGRSGSGKTTLLDALSALLTQPGSIRFNAAAREDDRKVHDRNWVSYVRGAWAEQKDAGSGEIATQFLRKKTTWSAVAVTYENSIGKTVVLLQIFWIKGGANTASDVRRHYMILERPFSLQELEGFDLDLRKLKKQFSDAWFTDRFNAYSERFRRLLGIDNELALKLLHKTQSAKNLGDLNAFLRDFMLDRPDTFDVAERLVNEFGELSAAHEAVVIAREQVETLVPAREGWEARTALLEALAHLENLERGIDPYRNVQRIQLLETASRETGARIDAAQSAVGQSEAALVNLKAQLRDLQDAHREAGGDRIERWTAEKERCEGERDERLRRRAMADGACRAIGWSLPEDGEAFARLTAEARDLVEGWQSQQKARRENEVALTVEKASVKGEFDRAVAEVRAMERQPSNIPSQMIALRSRIAESLQIGESDLPFVGELIQVKPEEAAWQGAIERVLHGFALSILVDESNYVALSTYVNDHHLGGRLVYYRATPPGHRVEKSFSSESLLHKLDLKIHTHQTWLRAEVNRRFDYKCVENLRQFRSAGDRALTQTGQVRHNRDRHEKDDRHGIEDRLRWVLGFDNREKLALVKEQASTLANRLSALDQALTRISDDDMQATTRAMECQKLVNLQWQEIDVSTLLDRIQTLSREIKALRESDGVLKDLGDQIAVSLKDIEGEEERYTAALVLVKQLRETQGGYRKELVQIRSAMREDVLSEAQRAGLDVCFSEEGTIPTLKNLSDLTNRVERKLRGAIKERTHTRHQCEKVIEDRFKEFKRRWPMDAGDMDGTLASARDFLQVLERLESDGLPAHEERFFDLLESQSQQNLAELNARLNHARKDIHERMDLVNLSLRDADFNPGTYLQIEASDRQSPEVRDFRRDVRDAQHHAWTADRDEAESRFLGLRHLVERLASQDPEGKRWRNTVLDVRLHVDFVGMEKDQGGREVEIYRSGAGKSGGQRQKLATTCLAAALRYQLGGNEDGYPVYAPVVLDEAFDKADNEFTRLAMDIFKTFGFQMIVATPLKSVMTLEPFIGGACFVDIRDRCYSSVMLITYDTVQQRLELPEHAHGAPTTT